MRVTSRVRDKQNVLKRAKRKHWKPRVAEYCLHFHRRCP